MLDRIAGLDLAGPAATLTAARRVILTGTGTSQHAAELGALLLGQAGLDARWFPAAQLGPVGPGPRPGDVLIVITHTGETAYAIRARSAALAAGVPGLSITGTGVDRPDAIHTVPREEAETYTVGPTRPRSRCWPGWPGWPVPPTGRRRRCGWPPPRSAPCWPSPVWTPCQSPARSLAIVGPGPWGITAREGALKLREGARMLAEGYDSELFLHGSAVPLTAADGVLLLEPGADPDGRRRRWVPRQQRRASRSPGSAGRTAVAGTGAAPDDGAAAAAGRAIRRAARAGPDTVITGHWATRSCGSSVPGKPFALGKASPSGTEVP